MSDVFISHAQADVQLAEFLHRHLTQEGLSVYLATVSMPHGERWMPAIIDNLRSSTWVICLASHAACESQWVMQEMGAAIGANKKLVPVVWDLLPEDIPGWMREFQAVNLRGASREEAIAAFGRIADTIKADKQKGLAILGLLVAGLMILGR